MSAIQFLSISHNSLIELRSGEDRGCVRDVMPSFNWADFVRWLMWASALSLTTSMRYICYCSILLKKSFRGPSRTYTTYSFTSKPLPYLWPFLLIIVSGNSSLISKPFTPYAIHLYTIIDLQPLWKVGCIFSERNSLPSNLIILLYPSLFLTPTLSY